MPTRGLFQLQTPRDLLRKLIHDYERLQRAPDDAYAAFDFFVTAEHMLDWLYPGAPGRANRTAERNDNRILQVVSHLATGGKHMVPEDPRHTSVQHADAAPAPYGAGPYGVGPYGSGILIIQLDRSAASELGDTITPLDLATRVLAFWQAHPALAIAP